MIGVRSEKWEERPLACVVRREGAQALTDRDIIEYLKPRMAKWWLPDAVEFVDELPKTSVGKIDKKVLRKKFEHYKLP